MIIFLSEMGYIQESNSPLYLAAQGGHLNVVRTLIASKVWVNQTNHNNETALFAASYKGYLEVVTELLAAGAATSIKEYKV